MIEYIDYYLIDAAYFIYYLLAAQHIMLYTCPASIFIRHASDSHQLWGQRKTYGALKSN